MQDAQVFRNEHLGFHLSQRPACEPGHYPVETRKSLRVNFVNFLVFPNIQ